MIIYFQRQKKGRMDSTSKSNETTFVNNIEIHVKSIERILLSMSQKFHKQKRIYIPIRIIWESKDKCEKKGSCSFVDILLL
ncbi:hypothetical protein DERP_001631 [Dermatophagoides pteronyssinus]|uniref:Uncharacterized protein n=1 Tax=Dermatophagoides pteronyssinus TaxID=6956 RepID=A0ABQ8JBM3_DERPT|nr:hypothetical protein DERP_001631 [Dermatophagoides pteronyssinus]